MIVIAKKVGRLANRWELVSSRARPSVAPSRTGWYDVKTRSIVQAPGRSVKNLG